MRSRRQFVVVKWLLILALGVLAGVGLALRSVRMTSVESQETTEAKAVQGTAKVSPVVSDESVVELSSGQTGFQPDVMGIALRYARAYQAGEWETVMESTEWMCERLRRVRLRAQSEEEIEQARVELKNRILSRHEEGNMIREDGVEDNLIFRPEVVVEPVGVDVGRGDLEKPAAGRAWLRVTFLKPERAPLGPSGKPVRALNVGLNVSREGTILKAAIIGNLDVDMGSVEYYSP